MSVFIKSPIVAKSSTENGEKAWLPLWMHGLDTAGIMAKLWDEWLPDNVCAAISGAHDGAEMRMLCIFLGLVHDIGKATVSFQKKIAGFFEEAAQMLRDAGLDIDVDVKQNLPHGVMGAKILEHLQYPECIAAVVGAHHGKPQPKDMVTKGDEFDKYFRCYYGRQEQQWRELWEEFLDEALKYCGFADAKCLPDIDAGQQMLLSGLLIMVDWIASKEEYFPLIELGDTGDERQYPGRVESGWRKINLPHIWTAQEWTDIEEQFKSRFGYEPYPVQSMTMQHALEVENPGIFILEGEMGCGKTEAALAAAEILACHQGCGGIFFGLPTQATANGIFPRLERWAEK